MHTSFEVASLCLYKPHLGFYFLFSHSFLLQNLLQLLSSLSVFTRSSLLQPLLWPPILLRSLLLLLNLLRKMNTKWLWPGHWKFELWTSQVMLPFAIGSFTYSFWGPFLPLPSAVEIQPFSPCSKEQNILITQEFIRIDYFNKRLFLSAPKNSNSFID